MAQHPTHFRLHSHVTEKIQTAGISVFNLILLANRRFSFLTALRINRKTCSRFLHEKPRFNHPFRITILMYDARLLGDAIKIHLLGLTIKNRINPPHPFSFHSGGQIDSPISIPFA